MPMQLLPPGGVVCSEMRYIAYTATFIFLGVGGGEGRLSLKLKSLFAGKQQVVVWRLAFAEGMLALRLRGNVWKMHFCKAQECCLGEEGAPDSGMVVWWCPALFLCSRGGRSMGLVNMTLGNKKISAHFIAEMQCVPGEFFHEPILGAFEG